MWYSGMRMMNVCMLLHRSCSMEQLLLMFCRDRLAFLSVQHQHDIGLSNRRTEKVSETSFLSYRIRHWPVFSLCSYNEFKANAARPMAKPINAPPPPPYNPPRPSPYVAPPPVQPKPPGNLLADEQYTRSGTHRLLKQRCLLSSSEQTAVERKPPREASFRQSHAHEGQQRQCFAESKREYQSNGNVPCMWHHDKVCVQRLHSIFSHMSVVCRGPYISAIGRCYCVDHFTCSKCSANLVDSGFVEENGKLYCEADFEQFLAPRCAKCSQAISKVK